MQLVLTNNFLISAHTSSIVTITNMNMTRRPPFIIHWSNVQHMTSTIHILYSVFNGWIEYSLVVIHCSIVLNVYYIWQPIYYILNTTKKTSRQITTKHLFHRTYYRTKYIIKLFCDIAAASFSLFYGVCFALYHRALAYTHSKLVSEDAQQHIFKGH